MSDSCFAVWAPIGRNGTLGGDGAAMLACRSHAPRFRFAIVIERCNRHVQNAAASRSPIPPTEFHIVSVMSRRWQVPLVDEMLEHFSPHPQAPPATPGAAAHRELCVYRYTYSIYLRACSTSRARFVLVRWLARLTPWRSRTVSPTTNGQRAEGARLDEGG